MLANEMENQNEQVHKGIGEGVYQNGQGTNCGNYCHGDLLSYMNTGIARNN